MICPKCKQTIFFTDILTPKALEAFRLLFIQGLTINEAAEMLDIDKNSLCERIRRMLEHIPELKAYNENAGCQINWQDIFMTPHIENLVDLGDLGKITDKW